MPCDICGNPDFDYTSWEFDMMEKYGFYTHCINESSFPTGFDIHTHGLVESYSHPDIQIVMPLEQEVASGVLGSVIKLIMDGETLEVGKRYSKVLDDGYDVVFVEATEGNRNILRMILPDVEGNLDKGTFKSDSSFDSDYYNLQYE